MGKNALWAQWFFYPLSGCYSKSEISKSIVQRMWSLVFVIFQNQILLSCILTIIQIYLVFFKQLFRNIIIIMCFNIVSVLDWPIYCIDSYVESVYSFDGTLFSWKSWLDILLLSSNTICTLSSTYIILLLSTL